MFRVIIGIMLLIIGFFVLSGALAATHGNPPTDVMRLNTWFFWLISLAPLTLGLTLLFWKVLRTRPRP